MPRQCRSIKKILGLESGVRQVLGQPGLVRRGRDRSELESDCVGTWVRQVLGQPGLVRWRWGRSEPSHNQAEIREYHQGESEDMNSYNGYKYSDMSKKV